MFILIILATFGISIWASFRVKSQYKKFSQMPTEAGYTGAEVAARILQQAGISDVQIMEIQQQLGDHYDPIRKRLALSSENFHGSSAAAIGVSAHECGHALQHKAAYTPLHLRMAAVGVTNIASQVVMILPLIGLFTGIFSNVTGILWIMAIGWGVIMAFNLITLPVEFDASRRAKLILDHMGFVRSQQEKEGVNKVLNAAAFTYVAAFLTSFAYFLYYMLPLLLGRRD